jgi:hypothetical protein
MPEKTSLTFRLTIAEYNILAGYAERTGRTQSDILREFIRSLEARKIGKDGNNFVVTPTFSCIFNLCLDPTCLPACRTIQPPTGKAT